MQTNRNVMKASVRYRFTANAILTKLILLLIHLQVHFFRKAVGFREEGEEEEGERGDQM
jgi:hypothetical protein